MSPDVKIVSIPFKDKHLIVVDQVRQCTCGTMTGIFVNKNGRTHCLNCVGHFESSLPTMPAYISKK